MDNIDFDLRKFATDGYCDGPRRGSAGQWFCIFRVTWGGKHWVAIERLRPFQHAESVALNVVHNVFAEEHESRSHAADVFVSSVRASMPAEKRRRVDWSRRVHVMFECTKPYLLACFHTACVVWNAHQPHGYTAMFPKWRHSKPLRLLRLNLGRMAKRAVTACDKWRDAYTDAAARRAVIEYGDEKLTLHLLPNKAVPDEGDFVSHFDVPYERMICYESARRFARSIFTDEERYSEAQSWTREPAKVAGSVLHYAYEMGADELVEWARERERMAKEAIVSRQSTEQTEVQE